MDSRSIAYYEANARRFFDATYSVDMSPLYEPFMSLLPSEAHILDAGCGSGRDSKLFLEKGYEVTAFDASAAMAELASTHIGQPVLRLSFDQLEFEECFDGVWACASLLHVPHQEMEGALSNLSRSLRQGGILYASFKHGDTQTVRGGRLFSDYTEESFQRMLQTHPELAPLDLWLTSDARAERSDDVWLNILLRKDA